MRLSRLESTLLNCSRGPFLSPPGEGEGGATGGNGEGANDANPGGEQGGGSDQKKVEFTAEQQAEVNRIVAKEKRDAAKRATDDAKAATDAAAAQAVKDREAADLKAKGDFEALEKTLKGDLDSAKSEATALKAENGQLRDAMKVGVEARWKTLPESLQKSAGKFLADDDLIGRWNYLNDPDTASLIKEIEKEKTEPYRGNQPGPKSNGGGQAEITPLISPSQFLG